MRYHDGFQYRREHVPPPLPQLIDTARRIADRAREAGRDEHPHGIQTKITYVDILRGAVVLKRQGNHTQMVQAWVEMMIRLRSYYLPVADARRKAGKIMLRALVLAYPSRVAA